MNGEQKGGVKNHFRTLFRIIKMKKQKEKILDEQNKELKENEIKIQKNKITNYDFNNEKIIPSNVKKVSTTSIKKVNKKSLSQESVIVPKNNNDIKIKKEKSINTIKIKREPESEKLDKKDNKNDNKKYKVVPKSKSGKTKVIQKSKRKENNQETIKTCVNSRDKVNKELESSILKRINKIIENDKRDIESLKYELDQIDKEVKNANDKEKITKIKLQFELINKKIAKIKRDFEIIKDNLEFEDYEELNNYFLIDELDDFKYHNDFASIELLSLKCKQQIEVLEDIVDMYDEAINVSKKVNKKNKEVKYFDKNTPIIKEKTKEIDLVAKKINNNLILQNKFIEDLNKKIGEAQVKTKVYYKYKGLTELLNNTLSMGVGIYSFSTMRKPRFRALKFIVGSILIHNSIKGMMNFLNPEIKKETYIYYNDYTAELEKGMSDIVLTNKFLNSSIKDIDILKRDFKNKFMEYQYDLPEYDTMLEKIEMIQKQLLLQKKELNKIEKDLELQKNRNKIYAKKMESHTEHY